MRNKNHKREYDRKYYSNNIEKKKAQYKIYYLKVREKKLAANKVWMQENKEYRQHYSWELLLKNKYNITVKDYNLLFKNQNGACAICGLHQSNFEKRLYVDHNHNTEVVRALLCVNCNMLIGHAREDIEVLNKAINYLKKHELYS